MMQSALDKSNRKLTVQGTWSVLTRLFVLACFLQHGRSPYVDHGLNCKNWLRINSNVFKLKIITFTPIPLSLFTWINSCSYPLSLSATRSEFFYFFCSLLQILDEFGTWIGRNISKTKKNITVLKDQVYVQCTIKLMLLYLLLTEGVTWGYCMYAFSLTILLISSVVTVQGPKDSYIPVSPTGFLSSDTTFFGYPLYILSLWITNLEWSLPMSRWHHFCMAPKSFANLV